MTRINSKIKLCCFLSNVWNDTKPDKIITTIFVMDAMIFAAGFGSRLAPLTERVPKALVPINSKPLLWWVLDQLLHIPLDRIVINTHYLAEQIEQFIDQHHLPCELHLVHESEILGTGGGLYNAKNLLSEHFIVWNVDELTTMPVKSLVSEYQMLDSEVLLAVNRTPAKSTLLVDEKMNVCGIEQPGRKQLFKQPEGEIQNANFCGIHLASSIIFEGESTFENSVIEQYLRQIENGLSVKAYDISEYYWRDVGTPESLRLAGEEFPKLYSPSYSIREKTS